jgi:hypothetical protein
MYDGRDITSYEEDDKCIDNFSGVTTGDRLDGKRRCNWKYNINASSIWDCLRTQFIGMLS